MTMVITDAQVHLFDSGRAVQRPGSPEWVRQLHKGSFSAEDLLTEMDAAGVARAVLVSPGSEGDGNEVSLRAGDAYPERLAVMGRLPIVTPGPERVAGWRDRPGLLGVRLTFNREPQSLWLTNGVSDWFWPAADAAQLPVMLAASGQLPAVAALAKRFPGIRLIIDHLGLPIDLAGMSLEEALAPLLEIAAHPNIAAKASALPFYAADEYPFASLHPHIRRVVEAFGPERVMWGTDLTRLSCSYREATTLFTEELPFLSENDLTWIMGRTAETWLDWPAS